MPNEPQPSDARNLLAASFIADPWSCYAAWRGGPRSFEATPRGIYVVHRYADVMRVLVDHTLFSSSRMNLAQRPWLRDDVFDGGLVAMDPPEHTARRRNAAAAVNRMDIDRMVALFVRIGAPVLDSMIARGGGDFIGEFGAPLQARVIAETLGASELAGKIPAWVDALSSGPLEPPERQEILGAAFASLRFELERVIDASPENLPDNLSGALDQRNADSGLGRAATLSFLGLWLVAAWETTIQLLANLVIAWSASPEACEASAGDVNGRARLVEEVLRLTPPVHAIDRIATENVSLFGETIPENAIVLAFIAAANCDDEIFPHPRRFDPNRDHSALLSFGQGAHYCLGAKLATLQAAALAGMLAERSVRIGLREEPLPWRWTLSLRTLPRLDIAFSRA